MSLNITKVGIVPHVQPPNMNNLQMRRRQADQTNAINAIIQQATTTTQPTLSQNILTGSRAFATLYQNTGTYPITVAVSVTTPSGGGGTVTASTGVNSGSLSAVVRSSATPAGSNPAETSVTFVVPVNYYYEVTEDVNLTVQLWVEWVSS